MTQNTGRYFSGADPDDLTQLTTVAKTSLVDAINEVATPKANGSGTAAAPTGNVSTTAEMMGLAVAFTPNKTGTVMLIVAGTALNSTAPGDGTTITGKYGTGTAPLNGAAATGTSFGLPQHFVASTIAGQQGFVCLGIVSGLTLGVAIWIDLDVVALTAGGASVKDVQVVAVEI